MSIKRIDSVNYVNIYEIDRKKVEPGEHPTLTVESHWNDNSKIHIRIGSVDVVVFGHDLKMAIDNAMNV